METLEILKRRLDNIGVEVEFGFRFPWVYLEKVNGKEVKTTYYSKLKCVIGFNPYEDETLFKFMPGINIFDVIRKYLEDDNSD